MKKWIFKTYRTPLFGGDDEGGGSGDGEGPGQGGDDDGDASDPFEYAMAAVV